MRSSLAIAIALASCSKSPATDPFAAQVPADTAVVATVSLDRLRLSTYWSKLETAVAAKLPLTAVRSACLTDPVRSIESIAVAMPAEPTPDRAIVLVRGVDRKVADACVLDFAKAQGNPIAIAEQGAVTAYGSGDDALYARWIDARTVAFAPGAITFNQSLASFDKPAQRDPAFGDAVRKLRRDRVVSFAFAAPPQSGIRTWLAQSGMQPDSGHGWVDLDRSLRGEVVLQFPTADAAAAAAKQTWIGPLAKLRSIARDREVVLSLTLDENETAQLLTMLLATEQ